MSALTEAQLNARVITTDRKELRLGELVGKPFILAFFPAAFSGTCTTEMCGIRDSIQRFNSMETLVYGISVDLPWALDAFSKQHGLNFILLSDANREAIRAFDVAWPLLSGVVKDVANRAVFVVDATGDVVYRWVADAPGNEPPFDQIFVALETKLSA